MNDQTEMHLLNIEQSKPSTPQGPVQADAVGTIHDEFSIRRRPLQERIARTSSATSLSTLPSESLEMLSLGIPYNESTEASIQPPPPTHRNVDNKYSPVQPVLIIPPPGVTNDSLDLLISQNGTITSTPRNTNPLNLQLLQVAKFGPTVIPLLFSAMIGSALRLLARWKAQKGTKLKVASPSFRFIFPFLTSLHQTLEILFGSRSLASTISTLAIIRTPGIINIALILLWCISPLAGQASLRLLEFKNMTDVSVNATWFVPNITDLGHKPRSPFNASVNSEDRINIFTRYSWLLEYPPELSHKMGWAFPRSSTTGLSSAARDTIGIPMYSPSFSKYSPSTSHYGWTPLTHSANLTFPASLFEFRCPSVSQYSVEEPWVNILGPNISQFNEQNLEKMSQAGSGFFLHVDANQSSIQEELQRIVFGSFYQSKVTLWNCTVGLVTRNFEATCLDPSLGYYPDCSYKPTTPPKFSSHTPLRNESLATEISKLWSNVDYPPINASSLTELFIRYQTWDAADALVDLSQMDNITFSERLTTTFNSFWILVLDRSIPQEYLPGFAIDDRQHFWEGSVTKTTSSTPLLFRPFFIIVCNWLWFTILVITSTILILSSLACAWLRYHLNSPDILGYVSSLTIDNPYMQIPEIVPGSGSFLDSLDRARILGNIRVKIGDVDYENRSFGKIALALDDGTVVAYQKGRRVI
ncbi:hypothetical protein G7Y89_g6411 [Cudoniella acicularis]|uniref:Uncharacterized protein n=1 Tax=Cudoniella acicularis TaxID=354080 RepID=A0A8H4RLC3_9HELO|nr:hypothetical protein G7Y89_g6411 [Cudoniella acicularis]